MAQIIEGYFEDLWVNSVSIPQILAAKINSEIPKNATLNQLKKALRDIKAISSANDVILNIVRLRVALWRAAQYIFIIGPPGAGKTKVRNILQEIFIKMGINSVSYADYPILYEFFLNEVLESSGYNNERIRNFKPDKFGGFEIINSNVFDDAIQELKEICLYHSHENISLDESAPIVLLEFARSNYLNPLEKFGNTINERSQVIYVTASPESCASRIKGRSKKPSVSRKETQISVLASDEHYISEKAVENLYSKDDYYRLKERKCWTSRTHVIDTDEIAEDDLEELLFELLKTVSERVWQGKITNNMYYS